MGGAPRKRKAELNGFDTEVDPPLAMMRLFAGRIWLGLKFAGGFFWEEVLILPEVFFFMGHVTKVVPNPPQRPLLQEIIGGRPPPGDLMSKFQPPTKPPFPPEKHLR